MMLFERVTDDKIRNRAFRSASRKAGRYAISLVGEFSEWRANSETVRLGALRSEHGSEHRWHNRVLLGFIQTRFTLYCLYDSSGLLENAGSRWLEIAHIYINNHFLIDTY